jgi:p21-activated kinase 1
LEAFIDNHTDPREHYVDLQEIAEGESGSVSVARVVNGHKLNLSNSLASKSTMSSLDAKPEYVAIKNVPISPSGSPKLIDLERELTLLKGMRHEHVLGMDALYVDLVEDSLWIRMELMERSLADVVGLVGEGLMIQERMIGRFANDVSRHCLFLVWTSIQAHINRRSC